MTARQARLGAVFALTAVILTGCGIAGADAEPTTTASAKLTPREALLAAVPDEEEGAYRFAVKGGQTPLSGVVDARKKAFEAKAVHTEDDVDLTMTMTTLVVDQDAWMKISFRPADLPGLPKLPKKWLKLDTSKLDEDYTGAFADPGYAQLLVTNAGEVTGTGPGTYAGTTDLTRSGEAEILGEEALKALGDKAASVPFTAEVDGTGNLATMTVEIPAAGKTKATTYTINYTGYGVTASPGAPAAGEQAPAPAALYEMVNG